MVPVVRKRKVLKQIFREERRVLEESEKIVSSSDPQQALFIHVRKHLDHIAYLLDKVERRKSLDLVAIVVRFGIAVILFFLTIAEPYTLLRKYYLNPESAISQSSEEGKTVIRRFIPQVTVGFSSKPFQQSQTAGPVSLLSSEDTSGFVAGIIPEKEGEAVYYTQRRDRKMLLMKAVMDGYFRKTSMASAEFWTDQDFKGAVVTAGASSSLVVASFDGKDGPSFYAQVLSGLGEPLTERKVVLMDEDNESVESIQAIPWDDGWALTTRVPRSVDAPLTEPMHIVVRFFDQELNLRKKMIFESTGFDLNHFVTLKPRQLSGEKGYTLIGTGRPSFRTSSIALGDDLLAYQFDEAGEATRILRLTNNGMEHDFSATGMAMDRSGNVFLSVQNIPYAKLEDDKNAFPLGSGRSFIRIYDTAMQSAGAFILLSTVPAHEASDRTGISNVRQVVIGERLFVAFDLITEDKDGNGNKERTLQVMWFHIKR
jgi:hypothetical protein